MKNLDARSFDGFKSYLKKALEDKDFIGEIDYIFNPVCIEASMWANKKGPKMIKINEDYFAEDSFAAEKFSQEFSKSLLESNPTLTWRLEFLVRKRYLLQTRSVSGIVGKDYAFQDFGRLVLRLSTLRECELVAAEFGLHKTISDILDGYFLGDDWVVYPA